MMINVGIYFDKLFFGIGFVAFIGRTEKNGFVLSQNNHGKIEIILTRLKC